MEHVVFHLCNRQLCTSSVEEPAEICEEYPKMKRTVEPPLDAEQSTSSQSPPQPHKLCKRQKTSVPPGVVAEDGAGGDWPPGVVAENGAGGDCATVNQKDTSIINKCKHCNSCPNCGDVMNGVDVMNGGGDCNIVSEGHSKCVCEMCELPSSDNLEHYNKLNCKMYSVNESPKDLSLSLTAVPQSSGKIPLTLTEVPLSPNAVTVSPTEEPLINSLPQTILIQIFQNLSLQDILHRVSLVCKRWHYLCCDSDMWRNVNLKGQLKVTDPLLLRLTSYSGNVTSLDLTDVRLTTNEGMAATLKQCSQLQYLSLVRCMHLTDYAFLAIGEHCHQMVNLKLDCCSALTDQSLIKIGDGCPKVEKLWLNQCSSITDKGIIPLVQKCTKLKQLSMEQCTEISDDFFEPLTDNCPHIQYLSFMSNDFTSRGVFLLGKLQQLSHLEITQISSLVDDNIIHLVKKCPSLRVLNVSLCTQITDNSVKFLARHAKNIKCLYLVACKLTDESLFSLADHCKGIEKVDVGWCTEITDEGAIKVSEGCRRLQYLGLMRCDRVTREASQNLVERFPLINYSTMWLECERLLARARSAGYCTL